MRQRVALSGKRSGKGEHETLECKTFFSLRDISRKTVKDAAQPLTMRPQQFDHIIVRVAHMNDTGQIAFTRKLKMRHKHGALRVSRREHPKIVQPELANRHHLRLLRHFTVTRS